VAKLKPIFDRRDGSVTVGNSCQVTDGAATCWVMDGEFAHAEGHDVMGFVRAYAYAGLDPARMGSVPFSPSTSSAQDGLTIADIPLFEINEAFADRCWRALKAMASDSFAKEQLES
jgi:acetyl-CoA acetyltransferase